MHKITKETNWNEMELLSYLMDNGGDWLWYLGGYKMGGNREKGGTTVTEQQQIHK